jgi:hypothetical protein
MHEYHHHGRPAQPAARQPRSPRDRARLDEAARLLGRTGYVVTTNELDHALSQPSHRVLLWSLGKKGAAVLSGPRSVSFWTDLTARIRLPVKRRRPRAMP